MSKRIRESSHPVFIKVLQSIPNFFRLGVVIIVLLTLFLKKHDYFINRFPSMHCFEEPNSPQTTVVAALKQNNNKRKVVLFSYKCSLNNDKNNEGHDDG